MPTSKHQDVFINLPSDAKARKDIPIMTGVIDYFPAALAEVAKVSKFGNDQHNPGQPLHWAREKSNDQADTIVRHLMERGTFDKDGVRHSAKAAWRCLALLQIELEKEAGFCCGKSNIETIGQVGTWQGLTEKDRQTLLERMSEEA